MNIILADDERLPRLGLKSMIEELFPNQHTFIEITNGEELLLYVEPVSYTHLTLPTILRV